MRGILIVLHIIIIFLVVSCSNNDVKIKSDYEVIYKAINKSGEITKGKRDKNRRASKTIFDQKGKEIEYTNYYYDDEMATKITYKYDEKDNLIEQKGGFYGIVKYKYDEKGNMLEKLGHRNSYFSVKELYKYDEKSNMVEKTIYESENTIHVKFIYQYDNNNKLIEVSVQNSNGLISLSESYEYNNIGIKTEKREYIKLQKDKPETTLDKRTLYDKKGNIIEVYARKYGDDVVYKSSTFKYDEQNNVIESLFYNEDGSVKYKTTMEYQYDNYNNWIKCIEYDYGKAVNIIEREIVYYDN